MSRPEPTAATGPSPLPEVPWTGLLIHALPLLGVMFLGWSLFSVMLIYWMEMGLMVVAATARVCWSGTTPIRNSVMMLLFSPMYFGPALGFVLAFFMAVVTFFHGPEVIVHSEDMPSMGEVGQRIIDEWLWVPVLLLIANHVWDFVEDWVRSGVYRNASMIVEMFKLYGTVLLMKLVLILAAVLLMKTGMGSLAVAFVVLVRIGLDVALYHINRRFGPERVQAAAA
ncbi:MAG: hypothetical protein JJT88_16175 [Gammaproteobacteria bacterium]|nr:hypothetical protein [Gammaproteobacteria bacterium]